MDLHEAFSRFDENGDGSISREEFEQGLHKAGFRLSSDAREQLVKRLDIDGDGLIEYHEFVRFAQTQSVPVEVRKGV